MGFHGRRVAFLCLALAHSLLCLSAISKLVYKDKIPTNLVTLDARALAGRREEGILIPRRIYRSDLFLIPRDIARVRGNGIEVSRLAGFRGIRIENRSATPNSSPLKISNSLSVSFLFLCLVQSFAPKNLPKQVCVQRKMRRS